MNDGLSPSMVKLEPVGVRMNLCYENQVRGLSCIMEVVLLLGSNNHFQRKLVHW